MQRFEDVVAWQKARILNRDLYRLTQRQPFSRDFGLASQIQRASVSVMANIAEGFDRATAAEFHQFLSIAKGSAAEIRSHLYAAYDAGYISQQEFDVLQTQVREVSRLVAALRRSVRTRVEDQKDPQRH